MNADKRNLLLAAFEYTYREFAVGTDDVARKLNVDGRKAYDLMRELEGYGLVTSDSTEGSGGWSNRGRNRGGPGNNAVGKNLIWQCIETYDSISAEQNRERFEKRVPQAAPPKQ